MNANAYAEHLASKILDDAERRIAGFADNTKIEVLQALGDQVREALVDLVISQYPDVDPTEHLADGPSEWYMEID